MNDSTRPWFHDVAACRCAGREHQHGQREPGDGLHQRLLRQRQRRGRPRVRSPARAEEKQLDGGFTLVGFSQGGQFARAVVQRCGCAPSACLQHAGELCDCIGVSAALRLQTHAMASSL